MKRTRWQFALWLGFALFSIPVAAYADFGTPLILTGMCHLAFGNCLIGIGEGILIGRLFKTDRGSAIGKMIGANYFSAFIGYILPIVLGSFGWSVNRLLVINVYNVRSCLPLLVLGSFVLTVFLEWPFCAWILKGRKHRLRTSFLASLAVQTASYAVLMPFFFTASDISIVRNIQPDRTLSFVKDSALSVYYVSAKDGAVYKMGLRGSHPQKVFDVDFRDQSARLYVKQSSNRELWDLWAAKESSDDERLLKARICLAIPQENIDTGLPRWFFRALDLRPENERASRISTGCWAVHGLRVGGTRNVSSEHYGLETPFLAWYSRNATILPGDQVVYQLGKQIVILDPHKRKIGMLAEGYGPVVLPDVAKETDHGR